MGAYGNAVQDAEAEGATGRADVYRFLQAVNSFFPAFDTPAQPFAPLMRDGAKRTVLPCDLTASDLAAVRELSKATRDAALAARLHDILWETTKDYKACQEAAASYIAAAETLNVSQKWPYAATAYQRGLYLAAKLGRQKDLFKKGITSLQRAARDAGKNVGSKADKFQCCKFLELLIAFGGVDGTEFAEIAAKLAEKAANENDPYGCRHYREVEADLWNLAGNAQSEKTARLGAAETYVLEAEDRAKGPGASNLAASSILIKGIEALRRAGATAERISLLRKRLTDLQTDPSEEMQTFSTPAVDILKAVEVAREQVKAVSFDEAILRFAMSHPLSDPKDVKEAVLKAAQDYPMLHLFGTRILDAKGRTTAKKGPLINLQGQEFEAELEAEMFSRVAQFAWPLRVNAYIEPARAQIFNDHHPGFQNLVFLVHNHPFVPPGHEGIFLRGIHAGFHGDFLIASHLLAPQIENSLRYVLESHGVDVSNIMSDGTQPVKVLGALFGMPETKLILGECACFELRGCLIEKTGYDFRNRVAHGFVTEGDCYSVGAITLWWLVIRILVTPFIPKKEPSSPESGPSSGAATAT
jgi:hypothetical protein